ncbi:ZirU family protein [Plesiomonas shigelloides]|uniref:Lipoprotein n=1 Tax=Plesiomonas shigelloides 302-73 TaxID=1315976 RepID=R8AQG1_PLESH|nr:ZirU family protein [Plesiomonas shigelloides]EON88569.1 hypothetical protein PLESHI_09924 [Plesiomonas shigelloides 302-73]
MKYKKTIIALAVVSSIASINVSAAPRANELTSQKTLASVGFRPTQNNAGSNNAKQVVIEGDLTTGSTLLLKDVNFTDKDYDLLSINKMEPNIEWYLVDNEGADLTGLAPSKTGSSFVIPASAAGKKIMLKYVIRTDTGKPDEAFTPSVVFINKATSGVGGDGADNGEIVSKLKSIAITVNHPAGIPSIELNDTDDANTPVVGSTLEASLICATTTPTEECDTSKYTFQWQIADNGTNNFTDIQDAKSHQYTVEPKQQNKLFRVHVKPAVSAKNEIASKKNKRN